MSTNPDEFPEDDEEPQLNIPTLRRRGAIDAARMYWDNMKQLGEQGQPPLEFTDQIRVNIELAQTAALVSMAESLYELAEQGRQTNRRMARYVPIITTALRELVKENVKVRVEARKAFR